MSLGFGSEQEYFILIDDASQSIPILFGKWIPFDICNFLFVDERFKWSVSLMVWNGQNFIYRSSYEVSIIMPISIGNFLSVLWNSWNLSLTLPVEEEKISLFCSNNENWMGSRPADVTCNILLRSQLNILELSLSHGPNGDDIGFCENGQRVVIFVPNEVVNSRSLVTWKFKNWFALSINSKFKLDDF